MRIHSVEVAVQKPVFENKVIGRIPADTYAQDKAFIPSRVAPEVKDWFEVTADVPVTDPALKLADSTTTLELKPYSPVKRGLACAALGGALAAGFAQFSGTGVSGTVLAGLSAATVGGLLGAKTASHDQPVVAFKDETVFKPELKGYSHHTLDGAYVPNKPRQTWPEGTGTLHYYMPEIEQKPVGSVKVPVVEHTALGPEASAILSAVAGIAIGAAAPLLG